jgi:hypothetical protein
LSYWPLLLHEGSIVRVFSFAPLAPNAGHEPLPEAGAQRTL